MQEIGVIPNGDVIFYDRGRFDDWCVYLRQAGKGAFAPRDEWYFSELQRLGVAYSHAAIYEDFVKIYDFTRKSIDDRVVAGIIRLTRKYDHAADEIASIQTVIYAGMVAEERKENTKLGKRVKRLGMHQALVEAMDAKAAANFSRGKRWTEIADECLKRGF